MYLKTTKMTTQSTTLYYNQEHRTFIHTSNANANANADTNADITASVPKTTSASYL